MGKINKKIGLYGIAANPPTLGHSHVIQSVLDADVVDEIWIIPTFVHFHGKQMAPYDVRVKMCEHAFIYDSDGFDPEKVKIKQIEGAIAELTPNYDGSTTSMLKNLRMHDEQDYRLIIGQDNADTMHTWKNGEDLVRNEKFIVIPRPRQDVGFVEESFWYSRTPNKFLHWVKPSDLSSTLARNICENSPIGMVNTQDLEKVVNRWVIHDISKLGLYMRTGG